MNGLLLRNIYRSPFFFTLIRTGFFYVPIKGGGISAYGFTIPSSFLLVDGNDLLVLEWSVIPIL